MRASARRARRRASASGQYISIAFTALAQAGAVLCARVGAAIGERQRDSGRAGRASAEASRKVVRGWRRSAPCAVVFGEVCSLAPIKLGPISATQGVRARIAPGYVPGRRAGERQNRSRRTFVSFLSRRRRVLRHRFGLHHVQTASPTPQAFGAVAAHAGDAGSVSEAGGAGLICARVLRLQGIGGRRAG